VPRILDITDLEKAKENHNFLWSWEPGVMPKKKTEKVYGRTHFKLRCACNTWSWVEWGALKKGRTGSCVHCAKMPSKEEFEAVLRKHNVMWTYLGHWQLSKTKRRQYWMKCKCGLRKWVQWSTIQQGKSHGCKSCTSPLKKHGYSRDPIYMVWQHMVKTHGNKVSPLWRSDFKPFHNWAKPLWAKGFRLHRIDEAKDFSPYNCDFVPNQRKRKIDANGNLGLVAGKNNINKFYHTKTPMYRIFCSLRQRKQVNAWPSYREFYLWANKNGWSKGSIIQKRDRSLPHSPTNSFWGHIRKFEYNGQMYTITELSKLSKQQDMTDEIMRYRLVEQKWSVEKALSEPRKFGKRVERTWEYEGRKLNLDALLAKAEPGISRRTLHSRLIRNWETKEALTTLIKPKGNIHGNILS
jgi:hypothetical protein